MYVPIWLRMRIYSLKKAAAVAAEEDTLAELDSGNKKDSDDDAYAEDIKDIKAIEVEDKGDSILD